MQASLIQVLVYIDPIDPETFGRIPIHEPTQLKGLTKKKQNALK